MKIKLIAGAGLGMLNPISLREDGWTSDMWLEVVEERSDVPSYKVILPNGSYRWIGNGDIKERSDRPQP